MGRFRILSHARLQEWVAEERGYFKQVGLDYEFVVKPAAGWSADVASTESVPEEIKNGAFESYEAGRGCDGEANARFERQPFRHPDAIGGLRLQ